MNNNYEKIMQYLSNMEKVDYIDEEDFLELKNKMKNVENSLKTKIRPKTITISGEIHNKIKKYCGNNGLNIGEWAETILSKEMDNKNKKIEVTLINLLTEYKKKVTKSDFFDQYDVNKINDIIYYIKEILWKERDRMKTFNFNLGKFFKDYDTKDLKDSIYRDFPGNKFIFQFEWGFRSKLPNDIKIGDIVKMNGNKCLKIVDLLINSTVSQSIYFNSIVFSFDETTFDSNKKIKDQIDSIFDVKFNKDDFKIIQYNVYNEKENTLVDLKSKFLTMDNDFICIKQNFNEIKQGFKEKENE